MSRIIERKYFLLGTGLVVFGIALDIYSIGINPDLWGFIFRHIGVGIGSSLIAIGVLYIIFRTNRILTPLRSWFIPVAVLGSMAGLALMSVARAGEGTPDNPIKFTHLYVFLSSLGIPLGTAIKTENSTHAWTITTVIVLLLLSMVLFIRGPLHEIFHPVSLMIFGFFGIITLYVGFVLTRNLNPAPRDS